MNKRSVENIACEVILNKRKWICMCAYRPPSMSESIFTDLLFKAVYKSIITSDHILILGDLNLDLSNITKGKPLLDFMDTFNLENCISSPTCFMKDCTPSLVDVILTGSKNLCFKPLNIPTGISDCHNFISICVKSNAPSDKKTKCSYRSFRNFDELAF